MCPRSSDSFPDVLVVGHDPKFMSQMFLAFSLNLSLAYRKNSNTKFELLNCATRIGDTLRAYANASKDDWVLQLPCPSWCSP